MFYIKTFKEISSVNWTTQEEVQLNSPPTPFQDIIVTFMKEVSSTNTFPVFLFPLIFSTHHYLPALSLKTRFLNNWLIQKADITTLPCSVPIKALTRTHQYINAYTEKTRLQINTHRDAWGYSSEGKTINLSYPWCGLRLLALPSNDSAQEKMFYPCKL